MARLPEPAQRPADMTALVKLGATDFRVWAIEFSPPPGPRGTDKASKPTLWKCAISTADAARPMISSVKPTAEEAESAAKALFVEMMGRRPGTTVETHVGPAPAAPKAKAKPVAPADDIDDDARDLI